MMKFNKGEMLVLIDAREMDMRFLPPGADKRIQEGTMLVLSHCKKLAQIVTSLVFEKSLEKAQGVAPNFRMFDSEQDAMKWLLE
jgi:hypothetical protein